MISSFKKKGLGFRGNPKKEPQQYSRNIIGHRDPGRYIPIIFLLDFLGFPVWGSL